MEETYLVIPYMSAIINYICKNKRNATEMLGKNV